MASFFLVICTYIKEVSSITYTWIINIPTAYLVHLTKVLHVCVKTGYATHMNHRSPNDLLWVERSTFTAAHYPAGIKTSYYVNLRTKLQFINKMSQRRLIYPFFVYVFSKMELTIVQHPTIHNLKSTPTFIAHKCIFYQHSIKHSMNKHCMNTWFYDSQ